MEGYIQYHRQPGAVPLSVSDYNQMHGATLVSHPDLEAKVHEAHAAGLAQHGPGEYLENEFPSHDNCVQCASQEVDLDTHLKVMQFDPEVREKLFVFGPGQFMKGKQRYVNKIVRFLNGEDGVVRLTDGTQQRLSHLVSSKASLMRAMQCETGPYYIDS